MKFIKQVSLYTLVGVISAGINFFVMPVLSHYLSPADYGLLSLFNTYIAILIPVVSVSAYSILSVDYFKKSNKEDYAAQFTSIQLIPILNSFVLSLFVWISFNTVADDLELSGLGTGWGLMIVGLTMLNIYHEQFMQFLVLQKKASTFTLYSLTKVFIEVGLTFYLVVNRGLNWEGRMYSWLAVSVIFFIIAFIYFYRNGFIKGPVKFSYIREGVLFGGPLVLHGIGKLVINQSDRIFIAKMLPNGIHEAGIYSIGYTVGSLVLVAVSAFFNFYTPFLMERLSNLTEQGRLQVVKVGYWYILGCIGMLVLVLIFAPFLFYHFIDERYHGGLKYVFWVALGYCFWGGYLLFSGFVFYQKKSSILGWLALFNVGSNLVLNYYFIQAFGAIGAAYATALSFFLVMVIVAYIAQKLYPMPWRNYQRVRLTKLS